MRPHNLWILLLTVALVGAWTVPALAQSSNFNTSLHKTRAGKDYWYGTANGGFETFTGIPIEDLGCNGCHGPTNADGNPYPEPYPGANCIDCHPGTFFPVTESQCYGCHGRQATEVNVLGYSDVHRDAGMVCWDCHSTQDIHGDGVQYSSMLEPDAIKADCENCHTNLPPEHAGYDPHGGDLHCKTCHAQTVISCYNCHFESLVEGHQKRAKQPLHDFVILVNREEDGKVHPASFQSITNDGDAFVAFGPFTPHTITRENARTCDECHVNMGGSNAAIEQYNATGEIRFAEWNDVDSTLSWVHGIIPFPDDYQTSFKMDFLTFDGDPSSPPGPSNNWSYIGKDTWDGHQLFFATPLTPSQMQALGMTGPVGVEDPSVVAPIVLRAAEPNPFRKSTSIGFTLDQSQKVRLTIHDVMGRAVETLVDEVRSAGDHRVAWDAGSDLPAGVYFYRFQAGDIDETKRVVLVR